MFIIKEIIMTFHLYYTTIWPICFTRV